MSMIKAEGVLSLPKSWWLEKKLLDTVTSNGLFSFGEKTNRVLNLKRARKHRRSDFQKYILTALLKEKENYSARMKKWREKHEQQINVQLEYESLIEQGMLKLNEENKYELTEKGREEAEKSAKEMKKPQFLLEINC